MLPLTPQKCALQDRTSLRMSALQGAVDSRGV